MRTTTPIFVKMVSGAGKFFFWRFFIARLFYRWWHFRACKIAKNLAPHLKDARTVIDIGAGNGLIASELTRLCPHLAITLVDVMDWNMSLLPLVRFDGISLPFEDDTFDFAFLIDVLHHAEDQKRILEDALRVASRVLVSEPLHENVVERISIGITDNLQFILYGMALACNHFRKQDLLQFFELITNRVESLGEIFWRHPAFLLSRED